MGIFDQLKEPVFLKESSDARRQLEVLRELEPRLTPEGQDRLRQDMRNLEYGIQGEDQIAFELKNSHMAMYILHDIYLEDGDLSAQIDYIVVTRKLCFIIECKNLYGNIEITNSGNFIRTIEYGGYRKKEGIYSPITQNERHMELLKKIKSESRSNFLVQRMISASFGDLHKSIVVLANPKSILNSRYAKKEIRDKVIRADQLVAYIKEQNRLSKEIGNSDAQLKKWAESFLKHHKEVEKDYTSKYDPYLLHREVDMEEDRQGKAVEKEGQSVSGGPDSRGGAGVEWEEALFQELKAYRLKKSREERIKPYYICNDSQLKDLISKMPGSKAELQSVWGFGPAKAEKYGADILEIVSNYRNV